MKHVLNLKIELFALDGLSANPAKRAGLAELQIDCGEQVDKAVDIFVRLAAELEAIRDMIMSTDEDTPVEVHTDTEDVETIQPKEDAGEGKA